jgi:putative endonuclease
LAAHNAGRGAAYTAARRPVRCLGSWRFANHSDALRAEAAFKRQPRAAKLERLRQQAAFQGGIFVRGLYALSDK